jgi:hypothetical protein
MKKLPAILLPALLTVVSLRAASHFDGPGVGLSLGQGATGAKITSTGNGGYKGAFLDRTSGVPGCNSFVGGLTAHYGMVMSGNLYLGGELAGLFDTMNGSVTVPEEYTLTVKNQFRAGFSVHLGMLPSKQTLGYVTVGLSMMSPTVNVTIPDQSSYKGFNTQKSSGVCLGVRYGLGMRTFLAPNIFVGLEAANTTLVSKPKVAKIVDKTDAQSFISHQLALTNVDLSFRVGYQF